MGTYSRRYTSVQEGVSSATTACCCRLVIITCMCTPTGNRPANAPDRKHTQPHATYTLAGRAEGTRTYTYYEFIYISVATESVPKVAIYPLSSARSNGNIGLSSSLGAIYPLLHILSYVSVPKVLVIDPLSSARTNGIAGLISSSGTTYISTYNIRTYVYAWYSSLYVY